MLDHCVALGLRTACKNENQTDLQVLQFFIGSVPGLLTPAFLKLQALRFLPKSRKNLFEEQIFECFFVFV